MNALWRDANGPVPPSARSLHVAVATETYPPEINGVANTMKHVVQGLHELGHWVSLIRPRQSADRSVTTGPASVQQLLVGGLPLPGYRGLRFGLPAVGRLWRRWRRQRPDVVYIATQGPLGHAALSVARQLAIPTLTGFHTQFHQYCRHYGVGLLMRPIVNVLRHFHNRSDGTLVPTRALQRDLDAAGFRNLRVFSRGVDTELFSPERRSQALRASWGCRKDTVVALYLGRIAAEKNVELAIEAFQAIEQKRPDVRCVLVGDGPELGHLRRHHPGYIYTGAMVGEALATHYASSDVFVFPSVTETFGNVLLEAMASGVAPVAFDYAAAHEHLVSGENGYGVPLGDRAAFLRAAAQAASNRTRLAALGRGARRKAESLSWERVMKALEAHLFQVIDCKGERGECHETVTATTE